MVDVQQTRPPQPRLLRQRDNHLATVRIITVGAGMATVILNPATAADEVCHDEQMVVWANDFAGMLSLGDWLRDDLSYADGVDLQEAIKRELRSIIESAFDHPEARTIRRIDNR